MKTAFTSGLMSTGSKIIRLDVNLVAVKSETCSVNLE
jgi:hypothetical protein